MHIITVIRRYANSKHPDQSAHFHNQISPGPAEPRYALPLQTV